MEAIKVCVDCGHELPISAFGEHANSRDGYCIRCLECRDKKRAARRREWEDRESRYRAEIHNLIESHRERLEQVQKECDEWRKKYEELDASCHNPEPML